MLGVCAGFDSVNTGSIFFQRMLSEKKLVGFLDDYELPGKCGTTGVAMENKTLMDDDWDNL